MLCRVSGLARNSQTFAGVLVRCSCAWLVQWCGMQRHGAFFRKEKKALLFMSKFAADRRTREDQSHHFNGKLLHGVSAQKQTDTYVHSAQGRWTNQRYFSNCIFGTTSFWNQPTSFGTLARVQRILLPSYTAHRLHGPAPCSLRGCFAHRSEWVLGACSSG